MTAAPCGMDPCTLPRGDGPWCQSCGMPQTVAVPDAPVADAPVADDKPTSSDTKAAIKAWLDGVGATYPASASKARLLEIVEEVE